MQAIRIAVLIIVLSAIAAVLGFWWAGFAPFPTDPVLLASHQEAGYCNVDVKENNWAKCKPGLDNPYPQGSDWYFRIFPKGTIDGYGEYSQWGVEGFNHCWDDGCYELWKDPMVGQLRWKIYYENDVPHFGLGRASWVVIIGARNAKPLDGVYPRTTYTTYAACMYRIPKNTNTEWYRCRRIEPKDPWHVGKVRKPDDD